MPLAEFPWTRPSRHATALLALAALCSCSRGFRGEELQTKGPAPEIRVAGTASPEFRLSDQRGKVVLLSFGYTSCPDVCPLTLSRLRELLGRLGPQAGQVTPLFLTVDPERDSLERLRTHVEAFDPRIQGLAPGARELPLLLGAYGIQATRRASSVRKLRGKAVDPGLYYSVDHTGVVLLIDRSGRLRVRHPHDAPVEQLLPDVQALLAEAP